MNSVLNCSFVHLKKVRLPNSFRRGLMLVPAADQRSCSVVVARCLLAINVFGLRQVNCCSANFSHLILNKQLISLAFHLKITSSSIKNWALIALKSRKRELFSLTQDNLHARNTQKWLSLNQTRKVAEVEDRRYRSQKEVPHYAKGCVPTKYSALALRCLTSTSSSIQWAREHTV